MVRAAFILWMLSAGICSAINPFPDTWSSSWTNNASDTNYIPTKQDYIDLACALNERLNASLLSGYSYWFTRDKVNYPTETNWIYNWYDEPWQGTQKVWWAWSTYTNIPELFHLSTNDVGEWVDNEPYAVDWQAGMYSRIALQALLMSSFFVRDDMTTSNILAHMNSTNLALLSVPQITRDMRLDNVFDIRRPTALPVWDQASLLDAIGIGYTQIIDVTPDDKRIVAALPVNTEEPCSVPMVEMIPTWDGSTWLYSTSFPRLPYIPTYDSRVLDQDRLFMVYADTDGYTSSISAEITFVTANTSSVLSCTNNYKRIHSWPNDWSWTNGVFYPMIYPIQEFIGYRLPTYYESGDGLWGTSTNKLDITLPWETNAHVVSVQNLKITATNAQGMPKVVAGYPSVRLYGWHRTADAFGDHFPSWLDLQNVRKILQRLNRVPCVLQPYSISSNYYTYRDGAGCYDGGYCQSFDPGKSGFSVFSNHVDLLGSWTPYYFSSNYFREYDPMVNESDYGFSQEDGQSWKIGGYWRRQMWNPTIDYCGCGTSAYPVSAAAWYGDVDGAFFNIPLNMDTSTVYSVTALWTSPYDLGDLDELDWAAIYATNYTAVHYPARDSSMYNMVSNMDVSLYVHSAVSYPVGSDVTNSDNGVKRVFLCQGVADNTPLLAKTHIENSVTNAENDALFTYQGFGTYFKATDPYVFGSGEDVSDGLNVCIGLVGYVSFDFDFD